jgi:hypothetical protein
MEDGQQHDALHPVRLGVLAYQRQHTDGELECIIARI